MSEPTMALYEGMFLLSQQEAATDFGGCIDFVKDVFARAEAELIVLTKWDERRLAYTIRGQKRGTYLLAYFRARGAQIANIERDCNLSEQVLRNMILRAEHVGETELELAKKEATDLDLEAKMRREAAEAQDEADRQTRSGDDEQTGADAVAVQVATPPQADQMPQTEEMPVADQPKPEAPPEQ